MILDYKKMNTLLYVSTFFMLIVQFLINNVGVPDEIMICLDIFLVVGILFSIRMLPTVIKRTNSFLPVFMIMLLISVAIIGWIINGYSIRWFINGLRINGRYFLVFLVSLVLLNKERIDKLFSLFIKVMIANVIFCSIQYFIFGFRGDFCGGLFGTAKTNSWVNILLCVVTAYSIAFYANANISLKKAIMNCLLCVYIASLAEIKFFFFELILIVISVVILNRPNKKTISICIVSGLLLIAMNSIIDSLWSSSSSDIFSIEGIEFYLSEKSYGYASVGDLGRIGGISKLDEYFFQDSLNLFGKGLGSCEYGTPFYSIYSYLHYIWFGYLTIYLEMGWTGLILYVAFFIAIVFASIRKRRKNREITPYEKSVHIFSECMAIIGIVLIWYNTTVFNYPGFFLFLTIAFAFKANFSIETKYEENQNVEN